MSSVVCTLFENDYHHGVAVLLNSLHYNKYKGPVYVGYKGDLPKWSLARKDNRELNWEGASTLEIATDFHVHFLPINTKTHFVFYKPTFMLQIFEKYGANIAGVAYFDPDIVVRCKWDFFEIWMSHGVALVHERLNFPDNHPFRGEWKKVISVINRQITRSQNGYINSGFCGVNKQNIEFLKVWAEVIEAGIQHFKLAQMQWGQTKDRTYMFYNADQDALNIAAMCCNVPLSEIGPEGMDILPGSFIMSHALGFPKPWKRNFIRMALAGVSPRMADKKFFAYSKSPIKLYSDTYFKIKSTKLFIAAFISRFYRKS